MDSRDTEEQDPRLGAGEALLRVAHAVLQAGDACTPYRRAGRGPDVLLLVGTGVPGDDLRERLLRELAADFRVVVPETPRPCGGPGRCLPAAGPVQVEWLRDLAEGLGLSRPAIVADEGSAEAALAFTLEEPERVGPLVMIARRRSWRAYVGGSEATSPPS